ncbi:MAG: 30S ribosomal protein S14 [Micavibrio sp.]|nr:30S ribosomal protein S14 [Micavibrio sp.]|tara:strand:+ start:115 stop:420 length:306 start_codon:yes stop_codon:yes gene_type:complete
MAKTCMIERDVKREKLYNKYRARREKLLAIRNNKDVSPEERFKAQLKLDKLPKNSARNRMRNRCAITGRPRGYHGRFDLCRVQLRELASNGALPGVTKSSW